MKHLTEAQIIDYRAGTLASLDDYAVVERELAACPDCQQLFQRVADAHPTARAPVPDVEHPEDDILARYAQSERNVTAQEREHIAHCPRCRADVVELRAYIGTQSMAPLPARAAPNGGRRHAPDEGGGYSTVGNAAFPARWAALSLSGMMAAAALGWFFNQAALRRVVGERDRLQQQLIAGVRADNSYSTTPRLAAARRDMPEPLLTQLNSHSVPMGDSERAAVHLLRPRGTLVSGLQPLLAWKLQKPISGAGKYEITIVNAQTQNAASPEEHVLTLPLRADENGGMTSPNAHNAPAETILQAPAGLLKPATTYSWSVAVKSAKDNAVLGGSSPNEETFFRTLTVEEMGRLGQEYGTMGVLDDAELALAADMQNADSRKMLEAARKLRAKLNK